MRQTSVLLYFLCLGLLYACQGKQSSVEMVVEETSGYPVLIPFEKGVGQMREVTLSELAADVRYIPLETTSQSLLKRVSGVLYDRSTHQLYLSDLRGVFRFSDEGKFINKLGRSGQGPGEYNYVRSMAMDKQKGHICLLSSGKLIFYAMDGTWIQDVRSPDEMQFALLNDSCIAYFIYNNGYQKNSLLLTNMEGDSLTSFPQYDRTNVKQDGVRRIFMGAKDRFLFSYAGKTCFKDYYSDSLFVVTPDSLQARYVFRMGKYKIPAESRFENIKSDINQYNADVASYLRPSVLETDDYLFLPTGSWQAKDNVDERLLLFDKRNGACYEAVDGNIKDDIRQGLPFYPFTTLDDNTLLGVLSPAAILEQAGQDPGLLERIGLTELNEDDNPVLMIVSLK